MTGLVSRRELHGLSAQIQSRSGAFPVGRRWRDVYAACNHLIKDDAAPSPYANTQTDWSHRAGPIPPFRCVPHHNKGFTHWMMTCCWVTRSDLLVGTFNSVLMPNLILLQGNQIKSGPPLDMEPLICCNVQLHLQSPPHTRESLSLLISFTLLDLNGSKLKGFFFSSPRLLDSTRAAQISYFLCNEIHLRGVSGFLFHSLIFFKAGKNV